jgi:hypothetical protein
VFRDQSYQTYERPSLDTRDGDAATKFYCGVLSGREICRVGPPGQRRRRWFRVGGAIIETGLGWRARARIALAVHDPDETAERCWDAGFSVHVHEGSTATLSVIDPFGRRIELVPVEQPTLAACGS